MEDRTEDKFKEIWLKNVIESLSDNVPAKLGWKMIANYVIILGWKMIANYAIKLGRKMIDHHAVKLG